MKLTTLLFLLFVHFVFSQTVIETEWGTIEGKLDTKRNVVAFQGVPFAAPPVGDLRWRSPQPHARWEGVKKTQDPASLCPQMHITDKIYQGNEDCLYMDIYVPLDAKYKKPLPVMFWLFGGAFTGGSGWNTGIFDGANLAAKRGVIVVTANYRLGPLGFLALDELRAEDEYGSTGNYGTQDQRAAMQWVQRNILRFGGDPSHVTLFGQSAGGISTCWHLVSPLSQGLFQGAIVQSGNCDSETFFVPYSFAHYLSRNFSTHAGCKQKGPELLKCLRALPAGGVMFYGISSLTPKSGPHPRMAPLTEFAPVIDGSIAGLLDKPQYLLDNYGDPLPPAMSHGEPYGKVARRTASGRFDTSYIRPIPLISGYNEDEGTLINVGLPIMVPWTSFPLRHWGLDRFYRWFFTPNTTTINSIKKLYPHRHFPFGSTQPTQAQADSNVAEEDVEPKTEPKVEPLNTQPSPIPTLPQWAFDAASGIKSTLALDSLNDNSWPLSPNRAMQYTFRDYMFGCSAFRLLRSMAKRGSHVWAYHYHYKMHWVDYFLLGNYHCSELYFVWDNPWPNLVHPFIDEDQQMADTFGTLWSNFAYSGNPNKPSIASTLNSKLSLPEWPEHGGADPLVYHMDVPASIERQAIAHEKCAMWDDVFPYIHYDN